MSEEPVNQFTEVARLYDDLMSVVPYRHWMDFVERLWQRYEALPRVVLDLACGTGNVTLELHRRGYEVEGVDYSAAMLREARRKARGLPITFHHQDARTLALPRSYDACVCLFDSLNYLLEWEELARACQGVARHLTPGGVFTFDMNAIHALETGMFNQEGHGRDCSLQYRWKSHWNPQTRRCVIEMEFHLRTREGARTFHERHVQRGYTLEEITQALTSAGFRVLGAFEAYNDRFVPPNAATDRYCILARKERPAGSAR